MPLDDFDAPLGIDGAARTPREIPWKSLAFAGCGVIAASLVGFLFVTDNGLGGNPYAVALVEPAAPVATASTAERVPAGDITGSIAPTDEAKSPSIEVQNGVRVVRGGAGNSRVLPGGGVVIEVPKDMRTEDAGPMAGLVESGRYGPLPQRGPDGLRPADAYAGATPPTRLGRTAPRIALVVGGMGLSRAATDNAVDRLPAGVTLGFAPYGENLAAAVARARAAGHEIVLQVPMEGFGDQSAGLEHRLTVAALNRNLDDLSWLESRFTGYAGVMNFLGGRFLAEEAALKPVLADIALRGLYWLDDGSASRSLSLDLANKTALPARRAEVMLDSGGKADGIEAALTKLESVARAQGSAIGVASGLPVSVDKIAAFARRLEDKGIALVPVSAVIAARPGALSARTESSGR